MIFLSLCGFLLFRINRYKSVKALVTESYLTLCNPMDCRPPGSSVHGILQARILEWIAMLFSSRFPWICLNDRKENCILKTPPLFTLEVTSFTASGTQDKK